MKNTRVLIVDDEPGIRESLRGVLEDEGYSCAAVESGERCMEELARQNYEAILLDVWLPGLPTVTVLPVVPPLPSCNVPLDIVVVPP